MKRIILISALLLILIAIIPPSKAQEPPHPPTTGHGERGNQAPGGTAPVGGGTIILIALGVAYAGKKAIHQGDKE